MQLKTSRSNRSLDFDYLRDTEEGLIVYTYLSLSIYIHMYVYRSFNLTCSRYRRGAKTSDRAKTPFV